MDTKSKRIHKSTVFVLLIIALIAGVGGYALMNIQNPAATTLHITPSSDNIPTDTQQPPSDWQMFHHPDQTYSFSAPKDFQLTCSADNSCRLTLNKTVEGQTPFMYISVIPQNLISNPGNTYNYNYSEYLIMSNMTVGETKTTRTNIQNPDLNKYYQYTRINDLLINDVTALGFENSTIQSMPETTIERRYILKTSDSLMLIGAYLNDSEFNPQMFDQVLSTFTFESDTSTSSSTLTITPSQNQIVCTADAKLCPDGSAVSRQGPNCEFPQCPGE